MTATFVDGLPVVYAPLLQSFWVTTNRAMFITSIGQTQLHIAKLLVEAGAPLTIEEGQEHIRLEEVFQRAYPVCPSEWIDLIQTVSRIQQWVAAQVTRCQSKYELPIGEFTGSFAHDVCSAVAENEDEALLSLLQSLDQSPWHWTLLLRKHKNKALTVLTCLCHHSPSELRDGGVLLSQRAAALCKSIRFLVQAGVDPRCLDAPWVCPLPTTTDLVDALDSTGDWCPAEILAEKDGNLYVHYIGWSAQWDAWIPPTRVSTYGSQWKTMTKRGYLAGELLHQVSVYDRFQKWSQGSVIKVQSVLDAIDAGLSDLQQWQSKVTQELFANGRLPPSLAALVLCYLS